MKKIISSIAILLFSVSSVAGQPESPDLELEGFRIVGRDTRVFTVTGDRFSTVEFIPSPIIVPREERDMEASKGLIGEDERLHRTEDFSVNRGLYTGAEVLSGINTPLVLLGKASLDLGRKAGTVRLLNRMAKENTSVNSAPFIQDIEAVGYYDASFARFSVDGMYGKEDEKVGGESFRNRMRDVRRYGYGATVRISPFETWDASGRFRVEGAGYADDDMGSDDDELLIFGDGRASGDFGVTTIVLNATGSYMDMGGVHGTVSSILGMGEWLIGNTFGLKAGASFAAYEMPGDKETSYSPKLQAEIDWAVTPKIYFKASYKPEVVRHTFAGLYGMNGLVIYDVPMLFEDRKIDAAGEIGIRFSQRLKGVLETFFIDSENMPVYSRTIPTADSTAVFYRIEKDSDVEIKGAALKLKYENGDYMKVDFGMTLNSASWNVPYIPDVNAFVGGSFKFYRYWRARGEICYTGKHYVDVNSGASEDGFLTVDLGVDRQLWKRYLSMYIDIRNLTNVKSAWWTSEYKMPGTGIYVGLEAEY